MTLPAARQGHICSRQLFSHHPEDKCIASRPKSQPAVFLRHAGCVHPRQKQVFEIFRRKCRRTIVVLRAWSEFLLSESGDSRNIFALRHVGIIYIARLLHSSAFCLAFGWSLSRSTLASFPFVRSQSRPRTRFSGIVSPVIRPY